MVAFVTVCETAAEVPAAVLASPLKTAVIECAPTASVETTSPALPLLSVTVPSTAAPSRNWTVPVAEAGVTPAAKKTSWKICAGFRADWRVTPEAILLTVCATGADVPGTVVASPL